HNNIRVSYALPWYSANPLRYQFYLEGYSRAWSEWSESAQKEFTNLQQGDYVFKVRAMAPDGTISGTAEFRFTILPPWYLSWGALVVYLLVLVLLAVGWRNWYRRKLKKHREVIQANMIK